MKTTQSLSSVLLAGVLCLAATTSQASVVTHIGRDDGSAVGGPNPNASAAETAFLAAAAGFGATITHTFETSLLGYYQPIPMYGGQITFISSNLGLGLSGVSNTTLGSTFGYNVTPGGENWFGIADIGTPSATFYFAVPTNAFGFYLTGLGADAFGTSISVTLLDGSQTAFALTLNDNGGAQYFGFTDTVEFTSVRIDQFTNGGDAWGIDDVSYNAAAIPEPATWAVMIGGFGLAGAALRRRRSLPAA